MSVRTLIATLAVLSSTGSAIAQQKIYPYVEFTGFQSTKTRAEVMAELDASKASGEYASSNREYAAPDMHFKSTKTRAEVLAELRQAQADGMYAQQDFDTQYPVLQHNGNVSHLASGGN
jgi:hypothetical protein